MRTEAPRLLTMTRSRPAQRLFHLVCFRDTGRDLADGSEFAWRLQSADRFFARLPGWLDLEGKSVLDIGCGGGGTCLTVARMGAERVLGVDIQSVGPAISQLSGEFSDVADRCEFRQVENLSDVAPEHFDVVLSQDSFEHYAQPERFAPEMAEALRPGGLALIGFGPLWRSPFGAHIDFMTKLPWAHLIFPEQVVLAERRRFRPAEDARAYEQIRGGLNKMTLTRFTRIMGSTGLEPLYFATNRGDHRAMILFRAASRIPLLRELFTTNVYSIWRKPLGSASNAA